MPDHDLHAQRADLALKAQVVNSATKSLHTVWLVEDKLVAKVDNEAHHGPAGDSTSLVLKLQVKHGKDCKHGCPHPSCIFSVPGEDVAVVDIHDDQRLSWLYLWRRRPVGNNAAAGIRRREPK